tara:strand:+ start:7208 stop:8647 length:1440 start_codon:yes stop_codon:yes gene_type:complete
MRVYTAKYDAAYNTADNSLVANLLKYPEIAKKVIELYPRYTTTYLLEKLSFGAGEKVLGDNSFEWKSMGRYRGQQQLAADLTTDSAVGASISFSMTDTTELPCLINTSDIVRLASGLQVHVESIVDGTNVKTVTGKALNLITDTAAADSVVGVIGNAFGEGSLGAEVGEGYAYPETRKNWLTTSRKKLVIDARDLTDVTWVEHNGHRLWFFTKEQQTEAQFMYDLEVMRWFGRSSVADYTATSVGSDASAAGNMPIIGDGLLAQIEDSNVATYNAGVDLTEEIITEYIGQLSLNAAAPVGNEYVVFTGTQGRVQFHRAMKDLLFAAGNNASAVMVDKFGQDVNVGAQFSTYSALGNKITLVHCPVFDDPNLAASAAMANNDVLSGAGFRTATLGGMMVFLDMSTQQGVANIELISKGAEGTNRNWIKKYVPGMINPYDSASMLAASGDDRFECHWLTQSGIIVRNPLSCGILKPTGLVL